MLGEVNQERVGRERCRGWTAAGGVSRRQPCKRSSGRKETVRLRGRDWRKWKESRRERGSDNRTWNQKGKGKQDEECSKNELVREREREERRGERAKERERENGRFSARGAGGKKVIFCQDALVVMVALQRDSASEGSHGPARSGRKELFGAIKAGDR